MKLNKIFIVSIFLLTILTLTPLCASDDTADDLSISDDNPVSYTDDIEVSDDDEPENSEDELTDDSTYEEDWEYMEHLDLKVTKPSKMFINEATKITFTGNDMSNGKIIVEVDGKNYTGAYEWGQATVTIKALSVGTKTIKYQSKLEDDFCQNENGTFTVEVYKKPIIKAKDLSMFSSESKTYKIQLLDANGKIIAGEYVTFYLDSKKIKKVKTDKNGYASVKISKLRPDKYNLKIEYDSAVFTKKLTVKTIFKSFKTAKVKNANKVTLQLSTKKVNGKFLKGKTVTIKIMKKTYKVKINSKGIVKLNVPKSVFAKVKPDKYSYWIADAYFGKDTTWAGIQFSKVKPKLSYTIVLRLKGAA